MATSRVRWALAQLGRKPGASGALARLVGPDDLPGDGWKVLDERTWRTGSERAAAWQRRAHDSGSITAWRSFQGGAAKTGLWIQVVPLADPDDASTAVVDVSTRSLANLRAKVRSTVPRTVSPPPPFDVPGATATEDTLEGTIGSGQSLMLCTTVGRNVMVLDASSLSETWTWADMGTVAAVQASRLDG